MNGKIEKKTKIINNSMTPKWNEEYQFISNNPVSDYLHLIMKDHDVTCDDLMAILDVSVSSLPVGVVVDHWYPLQPVEKVKKGGLIHILFHLCQPGSPPFVNAPAAPLPATPLKLHLRLIEAKEIAKMDTFGSTDAYCVLTVSGKQQQRSSTQKNKMLPKWNQDFHFDISNPQTDEIKILMRDEDIKHDDDMANWSMPIRYIPFCTLSDQWVTMEAVPKVKKGGRLHLLFHLAPPDYTPFVSRPPPPPPQNAQPVQQPVQQPMQQPMQQPIPQQSQSYIAPPPPGYGAPTTQAPPPPGYGAPPTGYAPPPSGYAPPPPGYAPPQSGYATPSVQAPPPSGYGVPPSGYAPPPPGYGAPMSQGYPQQPAGYAPPPSYGYGAPPTPGQPQGVPPGYPQQPAGYPGYPQAPAGYQPYPGYH